MSAKTPQQQDTTLPAYVLGILAGSAVRERIMAGYTGNMPATYTEACQEIKRLRRLVHSILAAAEQVALDPGDMAAWRAHGEIMQEARSQLKCR